MAAAGLGDLSTVKSGPGGVLASVEFDRAGTAGAVAAGGGLSAS